MEDWMVNNGWKGTIFLILIIVVCAMGGCAYRDSLRTEIAKVVGNASGEVGVAIVGPGSFDTLLLHGNDHFPMQSVFKFPLAIAVLHRVDSGILSLDQRIHLKKEDLLSGTWSPLREKYPGGNVDIALRELLAFTVSQSDNNGCDMLFRLLGGTETVNRCIHDLGIADIAIVATEEEMHRGWEVQYRNWCTPFAMAQLLQRCFHDSILSRGSRDYLWLLMVETSTGAGRIKGQLPSGTIVAHKSGSSGTNDDGIAAATNDVGIVVLPNGRQFIIVVFVSDSRANESARDETLARISRVAWDAFNR